MKNLFISLLYILFGICLASCSEDGVYVEYPDDEPSPIDYSDTSLFLRNVATFPVGASVSYAHFVNDPRLASIVRDNFDELVFNSELKHGAIVKSDGTYDYTTADAFVALSNNFDIYGHVLAWHRHQNTGYLNLFFHD